MVDMTISAKSCSQMWHSLFPEQLGAPFGKLAIIGVGNEFNGDDAAGIEFVRLLRPNLESNPQVLVLEGATAPQNMTGEVRRFAPTQIILVDAAQMNLEPGAIAFIDRSEIDGLTCSTHTFPLSLLAQYLEVDIGCEVAIVGIQPAASEPFTGISPAVHSAVETLVQSLVDAVRSFPGSQ